jgi:hypothetical protein
VYETGGYQAGSVINPAVLDRYSAPDEKDSSFSSIHDLVAYGVGADGSVVGIGGTSRQGHPESFPSVVRFRGDGSPTSGFQGIAPPIGETFPSPSGIFFKATRFLVLPSGKILGGTTVSQGQTDAVPNPKGRFFAMQWNADGSLDSAFGTNGATSVEMSPGGSIVSAVLNSDGSSSWLIDEEHWFPETPQTNLSVWIVTAQGTLQKTATHLRLDISDLGLSAVGTLQADGKTLISGIGKLAGGITMARYNNDGAVDTSFGQNGVASPSSAGVVAIDGVRVNGDDSIDMIVTKSTGTKQVPSACGTRTVSAYGLVIIHFGPDGG